MTDRFPDPLPDSEGASRGDRTYSDWIASLQAQQRHRRRRRTAILATSIVGALAVAAGVVTVGMSRSGDPTPDARGTTATTQGSTITADASMPATSADSVPSTSAGSTSGSDVSRVDCDEAIIESALLDAPEAQRMDGTPVCSEVYWLAPVVVVSTGEALTVVFRREGSVLEPVAVVTRSRCPDVVTDEPDFDPRLCPS